MVVTIGVIAGVIVFAHVAPFPFLLEVVPKRRSLWRVTTRSVRGGSMGATRRLARAADRDARRVDLAHA